MADDEKKTTSLESATALAENITKFLAATKSAESESTSEAPPTEAADAAAWVRKKYDSMIKWMLGVFASIGLLIFGSVPFLGVAGNILQCWSYVGLAVAGVGLTVIIYAATAGYEPQDASLGELKNTFEKLKRGHTAEAQNPAKSNIRNQIWSSICDQTLRDLEKLHAFISGKETAWPSEYLTFREWWARKGSRNKASAALQETLESSGETFAHRGPQVKTVGGLIRVIGTLETELLRCELGDAGLDIVDRAEATTGLPTGTVAELVKDQSTVFRESSEAYARERNEQLITEAKAISDIRSVTPALPGDVLEALGTQIEGRAALLERGDALTVAGGDAAGRRAALKFALDRYLDHRALVLQESAVAQLRGNFRRSRTMLVFGALITTAGGVLYAGSITQATAPTDAPATGTSYPVVQLTVLRGTDSWNKLGECRFPETTSDASVSAYKVSDTKFILTGQDCAGAAVELKAGEFLDVPS